MTIPHISEPHEGTDVTDSAVEYGPDSPTWPCPICGGVPLASVSAILRAEHERHVTHLGEVDENAEPCSHPDSWFDRTICPEPCGSMHNVCTECGATLEHCPIEGAAQVGGPVTKPVDFFSGGVWFTHRLTVENTWEVIPRPDEKVSGENAEPAVPIEVALAEAFEDLGLGSEVTPENLDRFVKKHRDLAREGLRAEFEHVAWEWNRTYDGGLKHAATEVRALIDDDRKKFEQS